ncbi:unnamed protein product [Schistosoma mattheei]|uniref:Uncharacterized protein n=1 Tax=Schistosoma mattheei TaxID=31246 RepID=A0A183Q1K1_9TREM|nr:unnamed protein product [Schistosoma mattheei]
MYLKHRSECWKTTSTGQHNNIGKMSCSVESTEFKDLSSINAAKTFYNTCTIAYSMEESLIQSKIREMTKELFNGWWISSDDEQHNIYTENVLKPGKFNLTAYILPLIFQSGRTLFFSINLTEGYSEGDDRLIHIQQETVVGEASPVNIEELEGICSLVS